MRGNLEKQLRQYFSEPIRRRGYSYWRMGRVNLKNSTNLSIEAVVKGTFSYHVCIENKKGRISFSCTCPFSEGADPCKHLWAVILEADKFSIWSDQNKLRWIDELDSDWDEDGEEDDEPEPTPPRVHLPSAVKRSPSVPTKPWKKVFRSLSESAKPRPHGEFQIYYSIPILLSSDNSDGLILNLRQAKRLLNGSRSVLRDLRQEFLSNDLNLSPSDHEALGLLWGFSPRYGYGYYPQSHPNQYVLSPSAARQVLPHACAEGRCLLEGDNIKNGAEPSLSWDSAGSWSLHLSLTLVPGKDLFLLGGNLRRGEESIPASQAVPLPSAGLFFLGTTLSPLADVKDGPWLSNLNANTHVIPAKDMPEFLEYYYRSPHSPDLTLPEDWTTRSEKRTPQAKLVLRPPPQPYGPKKLLAELSFDYGGVQTPEGHPGSRIYQSDKRLLWERDLAFESECAQKLDTLGFPWKTDWNQSSRSGHPSRLSETVLSLTQLGWRVDAEGKIYRSGGTLQGGIRSDRDWFDLELSADFDGVQADVSSLLAALRKNEKFVRLGDGTFGILPEEWLSKYGLAARMGSPVKDALRFTAGQAGLLDALLSEKPEIRLDAAFQKAREKLTRFSKVEPTDPARTFHGTLRPYQREGLGWLNYLRDFGFGGCLADDMGLGKTVQVLAFLESHHAHRSKPGPGKRNPPSLAIVPKSLIFNWKEEVSRFTPSLRLLDHTGIQRFPPGNHFNDYDLILTTYGTLRRDAFYFKDFVFDYVVLDEAHTIKNPQSANAKAARLLKASHRLAMTGTPVQNRLGEIWSLFDFLNPGMLGASHALESASKNDGKPEDHAVLARALKPFLLRRTKEAVAKDLPKKTEQVLLCEMRGAQKSLYEGLRSHYRDSLLKRVDRQGLGKSKMHVLEALLRLRQAACHPGLIDHTKSGETASKLDVLLPSLEEVREGGHKAIVFSQFTSFLSIVQDHLAPLKMPYAYLDGATRDREEQVRRFQNDKDCSLFLISLKAGGLGLNLTEAEYVYLLDPWWNPAVEAQAIDRAHRIGQTKRVSAYRLISQGTVEEKIVAMQKEKKKMAEAVLNPEGGLLGNLTREDLEMLLS